MTPLSGSSSTSTCGVWSLRFNGLRNGFCWTMQGHHFIVVEPSMRREKENTHPEIETTALFLEPSIKLNQCQVLVFFWIGSFACFTVMSVWVYANPWCQRRIPTSWIGRTLSSIKQESFRLVETSRFLKHTLVSHGQMKMLGYPGLYHLFTMLCINYDSAWSIFRIVHMQSQSSFPVDEPKQESLVIPNSVKPWWPMLSGSKFGKKLAQPDLSASASTCLLEHHPRKGATTWKTWKTQ